MIYVTREDLAKVSEAATGLPFLVRDEGLLSSALARPQASFAGQELYPDLWRKAAALIESLARNHALVDGNKRTAWQAGLFFLEINGIDTGSPDTNLAEKFILAAATGFYGEDLDNMASDLAKIIQ